MVLKRNTKFSWFFLLRITKISSIIIDPHEPQGIGARSGSPRALPGECAAKKPGSDNGVFSQNRIGIGIAHLEGVRCHRYLGRIGFEFAVLLIGEARKLGHRWGGGQRHFDGYAVIGQIDEPYPVRAVGITGNVFLYKNGIYRGGLPGEVEGIDATVDKIKLTGKGGFSCIGGLYNGDRYRHFCIYAIGGVGAISHSGANGGVQALQVGKIDFDSAEVDGGVDDV